MTPRQVDDAQQPWFRALADSAPEVYFRYAHARFDYLSPSVHALTGHHPEAFYADPRLCVRLFSRHDRRTLHQALRARRALNLTLRLQSSMDTAPTLLHVRTAPVVRRHQLVAVEGVASIAATPEKEDAVPMPVQQQLSALIYQVHSLLHVNPPPQQALREVIRLGALEFDTERFVVREAGREVALTSREMLVLRYLLSRQGRVVTREQLLRDVWQHSYTGDDRTVDVHLSRLRRKLPSLRGKLVALKNIGYRIDVETDKRSA
jgi:DNA-binding winged helix-turn-helix (wHTH) protein